MKFLKKITVLFLASFILLGSSGFHIYKSICHINGSTFFSLTSNDMHCFEDSQDKHQTKHTCCESSSQNTITSQCCDEKLVIDVRLYLPTFLQNASIDVPQIAFISPVFFNFSKYTFTNQKENNTSLAYLPSPKTCNERLSLIATLRI